MPRERLTPVVTLSSRIEQSEPIPYEAGSDYLSTFENIHGDQWVFIRKPDCETGTLYGGDVGWEGHEVKERSKAEAREALEAAGAGRLAKSAFASAIDPLVPGLILNEAERTWLRTAWESSAWPDSTTRERQLDAIARDLVDSFRSDGTDPFAKHPNRPENQALPRSQRLQIRTRTSEPRGR
jgi:hypothetical protein